MKDRTVRLGFEVGTGDPVDIPIRHMAVTGQTQEAGKTTTRRGFKTAHPNVVKELDELTRMGFLTKSNKWFDGHEYVSGQLRPLPFDRERARVRAERRRRWIILVFVAAVVWGVIYVWRW